jgi:protein pelota
VEILKSDFKKGTVSLRVTDADDIWYLSHLIEPGDFIKGRTTRKIKIGDSENAKVTRKPMTIKIEAETINIDQTASVLRINGKVKEGPHDLALDSYHSISLEEGTEFKIEKVNWLSYQKQKLDEACQKRYNYLFCVFDREEAMFALTKKSGYEILVKFKGDVPKKSKKTEVFKNFHEEIIKTLDVYAGRFNPERIIIASPVFYKDDLMKKIKSDEIKSKIVLATCSDVTENALHEITRSTELQKILQNNRAREEQLIIEKLLLHLKKDDLGTYGWDHVLEAISAGAVESLLLTDDFIQEKKLDNKYNLLDEQMKHVDNLNGKIHILSSEFESGKKLNGLGGIAAVLRYKLEWKK